MMPKLEQTSRWASQEAAIKAEINEAKNTLDLIRMAHAIARLDALHAETVISHFATSRHALRPTYISTTRRLAALSPLNVALLVDSEA